MYKKGFCWKYIQQRKKINLIIVIIILVYYLTTALLLKDILYGRNIIFPYALNNFSIDILYPEIWRKLKLYYFLINITTPFAILVIYNLKKYEIWQKIYLSKLNDDKKNIFFKSELKGRKSTLISRELNDMKNKMKITYGEVEKATETGKLKILLGFNEEKKPVYLGEKALFQNILITRKHWNRKNKFGYV